MSLVDICKEFDAFESVDFSFLVLVTLHTEQNHA